MTSQKSIPRRRRQKSPNGKRRRASETAGTPGYQGGRWSVPEYNRSIRRQRGVSLASFFSENRLKHGGFNGRCCQVLKTTVEHTSLALAPTRLHAGCAKVWKLQRKPTRCFVPTRLRAGGTRLGFATPRRSLPPSSDDHHQKKSGTRTWPPCGLPAWSRDSIDHRATETSSAVAKIAYRSLVWF